MILGVKTGWRPISLKFCYFLSLVLVLSCGKESSQKSANTSEETEAPETTATTIEAKKVILCFGDSLTAGYGLDDVNDAYPAILQEKIDSLDLDYTVINSGLSGETTAGGRSRIDWVLNQEVDVFILELGANDGLRGVPLTETRENLQAIIDAVRVKNPETTIVLAGMQLPPNMGPDYTTEFRKIFPELATENDLSLIPFLLKDVGGIPELNQADGIHPTAEGHQLLANNVWAVLGEVLQ